MLLSILLELRGKISGSSNGEKMMVLGGFENCVSAPSTFEDIMCLSRKMMLQDQIAQ
jgi:hypothetical protein